MRRYLKLAVPALLGGALLALLMARPGQANLPGIVGPTFNLTARAGRVLTPDPNSIFIWGFADGGGLAQYPGPTLIVNQGDVVTVNLTNTLGVPVSIVFPGHEATATGGAPGLLTQEAAPGGGLVSYTFTATNAGTFIYHSGTRPDLQIEMGLFGALIVQPAVMPYHHEYLFLESEMDSRVHELVETGRLAEVDNTEWFSNYWLLNGRCAPDTMLPDFFPLLPNQPYGCMPMAHPGHPMLMRIVNAGRQFHPFHPHGNHMRVIARDGRPLTSGLGADLDLSYEDFTTTVVPGGTADAVFVWTGEKLGWDVFGHAQDRDDPPLGNWPGPEDVDHNGNGVFDNAALSPDEYAPDHGKPFPVVLPGALDLTFGAHYSGSPFLGASGVLPPGQGGFNPTSGFFFMWHSHKEKEMTNNNIFPGGMMAMMLVVPPGAAMPGH